ncbi:hypothetical protein Tco_1207640, partial [Tanacetum coccineum]
MGTIDDMKSALTQSALDSLCEKFYIPRIVHPELPRRNLRIRNSPTGKISVYTRFFDFANYRIPLSQFLVDILEYFQINLSRLSVIAAAKVSHFEVLCRVHGFVLTVRNFCRFYINSKNKGWISFSKRSDTGPVCYTKPLDSLKHWNDNFFWVDASVFPLSVPWHNNKTLMKDPHPKPSEFNADVCNYLAANPAPLKKLLEPFLCFVGISQYYQLDVNCYPTYLTDDEEGGDGFVSFINHADPTKVQIGEREVREGEVPLLELTRGCVVSLTGDEVPATVAEKAKEFRKKRKAIGGASGSSLPPKKLRDDHDTSEAAASTGGKSVAALQSLLEGSTLAVKVGVVAAETVPFVTSSVTLTSEHSSHHSSTNAADVEVSSVVRSLIPNPPIMTTTVATTVVVDTSSVTVPRAGYEPVHHTLFEDSTSIGEANPDIA